MKHLLTWSVLFSEQKTVQGYGAYLDSLGELVKSSGAPREATRSDRKDQFDRESEKSS